MSQQQVKEKVQRILVEELGSVSIDKDGDFFVHFDSAVVFVTVIDLKDDVTLVKSFAILLSDVPLNADLYRWAATEGQAFHFGRSRIIEGDNGQGRIIFEHTLLGDFLDPEELKWAVIALGHDANDLDDQLQARFGGNRFNED